MSNATKIEEDSRLQRISKDGKALSQDPDYINYINAVKEEQEALNRLNQSYQQNKTSIQEELD